MAAKSLQSCPTLCDPIDGSPPGFPDPGILQARVLEWVAISFSNKWKWKVKGKSLSRVQLLATPWTAAYQAPPSMGFSRQEYLVNINWIFTVFQHLPMVRTLYWVPLLILYCLNNPWDGTIFPFTDKINLKMFKWSKFSQWKSPNSNGGSLTGDPILLLTVTHSFQQLSHQASTCLQQSVPT